MKRWPRILVVALTAAAIAVGGLALTVTAKDRSETSPPVTAFCSMHTATMDAMHYAMNDGGMMNGASRQVSR